MASSASVHVSAVSWRRSVTRNGAGTNAPAALDSATVAIYVQEPEPGPLQALDQHLSEPAHPVIAEGRIGSALVAQAGAVELRRAHGREGARVEVRAVRRE